MRAAALRPAESVLDCTLGLASDALVAARTVGHSGHVVGVESSRALAALAEEGLKHYRSGPLACPIEVRHADSRTLLTELPDKSFDVVLFDPMFTQPQKASGALDILRRFADHTPLTQPTIERARRVARRAVVIKAGRRSDDLRQWGIEPLPAARHARLEWDRIDVQPG